MYSNKKTKNGRWVSPDKYIRIPNSRKEGEEMITMTKNFLNIRELMEYIKERYGRHWGRMYIYMLTRRGCFPRYKLGNQNIYDIKSIDVYISKLKRISSVGISRKK